MTEIDGSSEPFYLEQRVKNSTRAGIVVSCALRAEGWIVDVEWDDGSWSLEHADSLDAE